MRRVDLSVISRDSLSTASRSNQGLILQTQLVLLEELVPFQIFVVEYNKVRVLNQFI